MHDPTTINQPTSVNYPTYLSWSDKRHQPLPTNSCLTTSSLCSVKVNDDDCRKDLVANNNWLHKSIHHIFRDLLAERKNRNGGLRSEIICRACCSKKAENLPRSRRVAGRLPPIPQASIPLLRWAEDYQQWGGGGAPPLGAFNGIGAKMDQKVALEHLLAPFGRFLDAIERFLGALARFWLDLGSVWKDLKQFWEVV